jgi:hypothetical protein
VKDRRSIDLTLLPNELAGHLHLHGVNSRVAPLRDQLEERRKHQRGRTYLNGAIAFNKRWSTLDCLVRNLSRDGAKIIFADAAAAPAEFDIMIRRNGESRRARIVWRQESQAGILFVPPREEIAIGGSGRHGL